MLVAIFILLLIVFFPFLSLFLGVGFMVVLVKFWWLFLILFGCLIFCRYIDKKEASEKEEAKLKKQQDAIIGAIKGSSNDREVELSFSGERDLNNDSYVLYITKKYVIEKNDVLGKYVLNEKLYDSLNEVLSAGNQLEDVEKEQEKKHLEELTLRAEKNANQYREELISRNANIKKILLLLGVALVVIILGGVTYLHFYPNSGFNTNESNTDASTATVESKPLMSCKDLERGNAGDIYMKNMDALAKHARLIKGWYRDTEDFVYELCQGDFKAADSVVLGGGIQIDEAANVAKILGIKYAPPQRDAKSMLLEITEQKLGEFMCSACAGNAAVYFVDHPNTDTGKMIKRAMDGDQNARSILDNGSWASGAPVK
ncbi:hypothetical protein [Polynucleobacter sphagniphilus]|uniref:hypothetical protein n=1 Tax=Polynucleobacter sphagniphilus TaxID=1743169 RepID=UPI00240639AF|nr:hypothetical protein [Polynucleobacter sphagniphilus]MDF9788113.1 hypothetical protein [Polynucleobacter sphagniphilus]